MHLHLITFLFDISHFSFKRLLSPCADLQSIKIIKIWELSLLKIFFYIDQEFKLLFTITYLYVMDFDMLFSDLVTHKKIIFYSLIAIYIIKITA